MYRQDELRKNEAKVSRRKFVCTAAAATVLAPFAPGLGKSNTRRAMAATVARCNRTMTAIQNTTLAELLGHREALPLAALLDHGLGYLSQSDQDLIVNLQNALDQSDYPLTYRALLLDSPEKWSRSQTVREGISTALEIASSRFVVPPTHHWSAHNQDLSDRIRRLLDGWYVQKDSGQVDRALGLVELMGHIRIRDFEAYVCDYPPRAAWDRALLQSAKDLGVLRELRFESANLESIYPGLDRDGLVLRFTDGKEYCAYWNGSEWSCARNNDDDYCDIAGGQPTAGSDVCSP